MIIIHVSDPHIGKEGARAAWLELLRHITDTYSPAEAAIAITGDLLDAPRHDWAKALGADLKALRGAGWQLMGVPGNHDIHAARGVDLGWLSTPTYAAWRAYIEPHLGGRRIGRAGLVGWRVGGRQVLGLDTNAGTAKSSAPDLARGEVGAQQLGDLTAVLEEGAIVLGHHRVWWDDPLHRLTDAAQLHEILDPRAAAYLCGHQHVLGDVHVGAVRYVAAPRCTERLSRGLRYGVIDVDSLSYEWRWAQSSE